MQRTLQILNELEQSGVMSRYAIGGAMGATFYIEPLLTFDLDIFVLLPQTRGGLLTLAGLYDALRALLDEALQEARDTMYEGTPARVLRAEHLAAICVQTGRDKDRQRARLLYEQATLDVEYLADVLARHGLDGKWKEWTS